MAKSMPEPTVIAFPGFWDHNLTDTWFYRKRFDESRKNTRQDTPHDMSQLD